MNEKSLLKLLKQEQRAIEDKNLDATQLMVTGIVVDTDDPLQMGRLRVFCPSLNDDVEKLHHLPWSVYVSPLAGTVSNPAYVRGTGKYPESSEGAYSYGWWGIPEQGTKVLVGCVDGDIRRRFWFGCIPEHQETHTLFHGRYEWEDGEVDGPLTSRGEPLEPLYSNAEKAFDGEKGSAEWKTRQADYQATAVDKTVGLPPNSSKEEYLDDQYPEMMEAEPDDWVKGIVGAHGYDWSGNKAVGSHKSSRVFGFSTPGGHSFAMDDRAYNSRIRIRSATGHQIIMDDTNERIYLSTNEGNSWLELDSSGNIDLYSERRLSVHAKKDINFTTDETFRVKASKGIFLYSGDTEGQEELDDDKPEDGEIRLHSTADTHIMSEKNLRTLVEDDYLLEVGGDHITSIAENMFLQVEKGIDTIVNDGNYNIAVEGDHNHHSSGDTSIFAGNDNKIQAMNNTEVYSYTGKMDLGSELNMTIKSYMKDVDIESMKETVSIYAGDGNTQLELSPSAYTAFTKGSVRTMAKKEVTQQVSEDFDVDTSEDSKGYRNRTILLGGDPIDDDCIKIENAVHVKFTPTEIFSKSLTNKMKITHEFDTSVEKIQGELNEIQKKFNKLSDTTYSYIEDLVGLLSDTVPDFPWNVSVPIPEVPTLDFSVTFPHLDFPELNFDFCIDVEPLLKIDNFSLLPHGHLVNIGIDLGSFSVRAIKSWFNRQKNTITDVVGTFREAGDLAIPNVDGIIQSFKFELELARDALDNLVSISVADKQGAYTAFSIGIDGMVETLTAYNSAVIAYGGDYNLALSKYANDLSGYNRTIAQLMADIANDLSYNNYDFSSLNDVKDFFFDFVTAMENELGDIV